MKKTLARTFKRRRITARKLVKYTLLLALAQHGSHAIVKDKDKHIELRGRRACRHAVYHRPM